METLVEKLARGQHPVALIRYRDVAEVEAALTRGFLLVKFTGTEGGTEIGLELDPAATALDRSSGTLAVCGALTLDFAPVKCALTVDLATLRGQGALRAVPA
ncbi:MAG: hypothetical protein JNN30_20750 [Rhodanobacteraceae bacterium]|nr:hypothetical protein [Rhodanobacteraceae bacterium]